MAIPCSTSQEALPFGLLMSKFSIISSNFSRSSASSIFSAPVPRILTFLFSRSLANLIAVCPPNCRMTPSGFSLSIMFIMSSVTKGSKYNLSPVEKSVDTVSGLLLMIILSIPNFFSVFTPCTVQ